MNTKKRTWLLYKPIVFLFLVISILLTISIPAKAETTITPLFKKQDGNAYMLIPFSDLALESTNKNEVLAAKAKIEKRCEFSIRYTDTSGSIKTKSFHPTFSITNKYVNNTKIWYLFCLTGLSSEDNDITDAQNCRKIYVYTLSDDTGESNDSHLFHINCNIYDMSGYNSVEIIASYNNSSSKFIYKPAYRIYYSGAYSDTGGFMSTASQTAYIGEKVTIDETFKASKSGYKFVGWNTNQDGSGTSFKPGDTIDSLASTMGATVTLYPEWKELEASDGISMHYTDSWHDENGTLQKDEYSTVVELGNHFPEFDFKVKEIPKNKKICRISTFGQ